MVDLEGEQYSVCIEASSIHETLPAGSVAIFDPALPPAEAGEWTAVKLHSSRVRVCRLSGQAPPAWMLAETNCVSVAPCTAGAELVFNVPWDWVPHRLVRVVPPILQA